MSTDPLYLRLLNAVFYDRPQLTHAALQTFASADEFLSQFFNFLKSKRLRTKTIDLFSERKNRFNDDALCVALSQQQINCLTQTDPQYPDLLSHIHDPPPLLFYKGQIDLLNRPLLSVVGSRSHSAYGASATQYLVKQLSDTFCIVSGLAKGIDAIAHQTALAQHQPTIAVVGTGLDVIYPAENQTLWHQIEENGLILSEFPPNIAATPTHFPQRNRLISGISSGTLVVEAGYRSGAVITASLAADQGRTVYCVPGNILSTHSLGTHRLIQDGAKLVHQVEDILEDYPDLTPVQTEATCLPDLTDAESAVFKVLTDTPKPLDQLVIESQLDVGQLLTQLTMLELKELVQSHPGDLFTRI